MILVRWRAGVLGKTPLDVSSQNVLARPVKIFLLSSHGVILGHCPASTKRLNTKRLNPGTFVFFVPWAHSPLLNFLISIFRKTALRRDSTALLVWTRRAVAIKKHCFGDSALDEKSPVFVPWPWKKCGKLPGTGEFCWNPKDVEIGPRGGRWLVLL